MPHSHPEMRAPEPEPSARRKTPPGTRPLVPAAHTASSCAGVALAAVLRSAPAFQQWLLLDLTWSIARRIGRPAGGTAVGHDALQCGCFGVQDRLHVFIPEHDALERIEEDVVEITALGAEADWQQ